MAKRTLNEEEKGEHCKLVEALLFSSAVLEIRSLGTKLPLLDSIKVHSRGITSRICAQSKLLLWGFMALENTWSGNFKAKIQWWRKDANLGHAITSLCSNAFSCLYSSAPCSFCPSVRKHPELIPCLPTCSYTTGQCPDSMSMRYVAPQTHTACLAVLCALRE